MPLQGDRRGEDEFRERDRGREGTIVLGQEVDELVDQRIGVDARSLIRDGALEVVVPVERLERRRLGSPGQFGRVEDLKQGRGEGDEGACPLDEAEEGTDEAEAERVVPRCRDEAATPNESEKRQL